MKIKVNCADGTDAQCYGTVEIELPFSGLSEDDVTVNWTTKKGKDVVKSVRIVPPKPDWVKQNDQHLSKSDVEAIKATGHFDIQPDDLEQEVCDACGSDQTYDDEGRNISAL